MVWSASHSKSDLLDELDTVRVKPLKRRGLSKYYNSKSQSFSSLDLALNTPYGDSAIGLGKRRSSSIDMLQEGSSRSLCSPGGSPVRSVNEADSAGSCLQFRGPADSEEPCSLWAADATEEMCSEFISALQLSRSSLMPSSSSLGSCGIPRPPHRQTGLHHLAASPDYSHAGTRPYHQSSLGRQYVLQQQRRLQATIKEHVTQESLVRHSAPTYGLTPSMVVVSMKDD